MRSMASTRLDEVKAGTIYKLPFEDETFDLAVTREVLHLLPNPEKPVSEIFRVLKPGGLFASTEYSTGPGGDMIYPVTWAYDSSISFLDAEDVMQAGFEAAGFRILDWTNSNHGHRPQCA